MRTKRKRRCEIRVNWSSIILLLIIKIDMIMGNCELAELSCRDGRCVPLDAYCNGHDDCGDGSDEPALCTPCNRTYHGREGRTYELDLARPTESRLPFLCHLTFTAGGPGYGEFVQLLWDAFSIGRLEKTSNKNKNKEYYSNCPEGSLQLAELGRPLTGGFWCGPSEGHASYYSESSTVTVSIRLFHAPSTVPFEFRLRYRFISKNEAVARLGKPGLTIERGSPVPGTYCSRNFYECHKKQCRVQSPNYPGEYPRNATCFITVRQKFVPTCKHAMISVKAINAPINSYYFNNNPVQGHNYQTLSSSLINSNHNNYTNNITSSSTAAADTSINISKKILISTTTPMTTAATFQSIFNSNSTNDFYIDNYFSLINNTHKLSVWQDCPPEKDRLIFRDGPKLDDPILLIYCGGLLPKVTARGPAMLIEFRSSLMAIPLGSSSMRIELEIPVVYVDSDGLDYARGDQGCEYFINATGKRSGIIRAPQHTLPLRSICTWNFQGLPGDVIWIYFSSYTQVDLISNIDNHFKFNDVNNNNITSNSKCIVKMTLWDGAANKGTSIVTLCDDIPKLCTHAFIRNITRTTRPCTIDESYITNSSVLTIQMETPYGTALRSLNFQARYEFISTSQGGENWISSREVKSKVETGHCNRIWRRIKSGEIKSPRDVRLFGRGGNKKLKCSYRIESSNNERIKLTIHNISLGDSTNCISELDIHTGRPKCIPDIGSRDAKLILFEVPWRDVKLMKACLCDNSSHLPLTHISVGKTLELHFIINQQAPYEDFQTLFFYATFELIRVPECPRKQHLHGEGGELKFITPPLSRPDIYCEGMPWLIEARDNRSLFILTWGWFLPLEITSTSPTTLSTSLPASVSSHQQSSSSDTTADTLGKCPTANRILLYSGWPTKLLKVVCPANPGTRDYTVHIFSEEWTTAAGNSDEQWLAPPHSASLIIDFIAREPGQAAASWLEISKSRSALRRQLRLPGRLTDNDTASTVDCTHTCPELGACIAPSLWCDGRIHCPSGNDESNCGTGARLLGLLPSGIWLIVAGGAGIITAFACLIAILICRSKSRAKRLFYNDELLKTCDRPRRAPTEESLLSSSCFVEYIRVDRETTV